MPDHSATPRERWIFERVNHYIRKSWGVPAAISQAVADYRAMSDVNELAKSATAFAFSRKSEGPKPKP